MALIPDDPKQRNSLIIGILALAAFYFFWSYVYSPQKTEVDEMAARLEQLDDQHNLARVIATRGGAELEQRVAQYERHVRALEQLVPTSEEVAALISNMATEARRAGVELAGISPEPEESVGFYTREAYELTVVGDYHNIGRFLAAIASLERIITPVDLELERFGGQAQALSIDAEYPLTARLRILTYIVPAGSGPPPGEGQGQEGGLP